MSTRVLFLDDSGKPDAKHASKALVIAGFSVPSENVTTLSRRVLGAKAKFFPRRGQPTTWEINAADVIKPNPWNRKTNRAFAFELVRIVASVGGTIYSVAIDKSKMNHPMSLAQTPLQLQALVEHFEVECRHHGDTGMLVVDWSSHQADQHASRCVVASFVASRRLAIHPSVYYASSHATEAIQVADLVAGVRRRVMKGDGSLSDLSQQMDRTQAQPPSGGLLTIHGRVFNTCIVLF